MNKFLLKLKLQLFAEEELPQSEEIQEIAEPVGEQNTEVVEEVETSEEIQEVATPVQPDRNFEKDSAFAKLRREAEQAKKEKEMLAKTLEQFGFTGSPEEIIDQANAHYLQKPIEEVRQERLQQERMQQEKSKEQAELEFYRNKEIERLMQDDLKRIQGLDPTVKSLEELGNDYFKLIESGLDAEIAFSAIQAKRQRETKVAPASIGKINSNTKADKEFYTPAEVDKLSEKELNDPKVWERVRKSMTKWK